MKNNINNMVEKTSKARQRAAKKAGDFYYSYSTDKFPRTIWQAYNSCSDAKERAYYYCCELCDKLNGFDFIIAGHNCMTFSVLFKFIDKETGALCYAFITRDYDSYCYA